jgi:hypothetical protein
LTIALFNLTTIAMTIIDQLVSADVPKRGGTSGRGQPTNRENQSNHALGMLCGDREPRLPVLNRSALTPRLKGTEQWIIAKCFHVQLIAPSAHCWSRTRLQSVPVVMVRTPPFILKVIVRRWLINVMSFIIGATVQIEDNHNDHR